MPLRITHLLGRAQEVRHFARIDARLALVSRNQELLPTRAELALEATYEIEGLRCEHLGRPPRHRAFDFYPISCRQPSATVHDARYVPARRSTTGANDSATSPGRITYEMP